MLFGRALTTVVVSVMATMAVAAPLTTSVASTEGLVVREEKASNDVPATVHSVIADATTDITSILSHLGDFALDAKKVDAEAVKQLSDQFENAFSHAVDSLSNLAESQRSSEKSKRDEGKFLGLDTVELINGVSAIGNEVMGVVNKVKDVASHPSSGPDQVKQISDAISDILNRLSKATPMVTTLVAKIAQAA